MTIPPSPLARVPLALVPWLACCVLAGCATLGRGCASDAGTGAAETAKRLANHAADNAAHIGGLANIALGFIVLGGLALVASFVPVLSMFVPRKAAVCSIIFGFGVYIVGGFFAGFMAKFGDAIYWLMFAALVVTGLLALWPYLVAAHKGTLYRTLTGKAQELLAAGHTDAAAAFQITATPGAAAVPSIRKAILATLQAAAPLPPPQPGT